MIECTLEEEIRAAVSSACHNFHSGHYGRVASRSERRERAIEDGVQAVLAALKKREMKA